MRKSPAIAVVILTACLVRGVCAQLRGGSEQSEPVAPAGTANRLGLDTASNAELQHALQAHDLKRAEQLLIETINRDPHSLHARERLILAGHVFFLDGKYLNAAIAWSKADLIAPLDDSSRFTLAMADVKLHRPDWARTQLAKLALENPKVALYQYWLGRLDYDAQQYPSAIERLQRVIQLDPEMARAYDSLGLCYDYLGKTDRAIANYEKAVAFNRKQPHPSAWPNLDFAIALMRANQLGKAEAQLREALIYDSNLPQANYRLGLVLAEQGRLPEAIHALQRAVASDPAYAEPHYLLARFYNRLGRRDMARKEANIFQSLREKNNSLPQSRTR